MKPRRWRMQLSRGYKRAAEEFPKCYFQFEEGKTGSPVSSHNDQVSLIWISELEVQRYLPCWEDWKLSEMMGCRRVSQPHWFYRRGRSPGTTVISQSTEKAHRAVHIGSFDRNLLNSYCSHYLNAHTSTQRYEQTLPDCSLEFMYLTAALAQLRKD